MTTVRPILGEVMRYMVGSSSNPDAEHLVDLLENQCGCPDYVCRRREYEQRTKEEYECRHIRAAWKHVKKELRESLKEAQLSQ